MKQANSRQKLNATWIVIPAKALETGKSRLAAILSADQRHSLSAQMLRHVLGVATDAAGARRTVVVSRDPEVLDLARQLRLHGLRERRSAHLNHALRQGARYAMRRGARAVLLVLGDLPRVRAEELRRMIAIAGHAPSVVAAPDGAGSGTNALLARPPDAIRFRFGQNSLRRHRREARGKHCRWQLLRSAGLQFDVDLPAHYALLAAARVPAAAPRLIGLALESSLS